MMNRGEKNGVNVREVQSEGLFLSFPPSLEDLQNVTVLPIFTDGFMMLFFFFPCYTMKLFTSEKYCSMAALA